MTSDESGHSESGRITDEGIAALREKVGQDWPYSRWTTWNEEASRDAIRHFAFSFGDDNPLWWDPDYAAQTRWGGIIAPPTFLHTAGITPELPPRDKTKSSAPPLPGPTFWVGDQIRFFKEVREGDRIWVRRFHLDVHEQQSPSLGRTVRTTRRRVYTNDVSDLLAIWDAEYVIADHREPPSTSGKSGEDRKAYSSEELADIDSAYAKETIRGSIPRYLEDIAIGDVLEARIKGPLTVSDMVAWFQGSGQHELYPYRLSYKNRRRLHPMFYPRNSMGSYEPVLRGHYDNEYARSIGLRGPYDFGAQRSAWMIQTVTDWAGDDAIVLEVNDRMKTFTTIGDLTHIEGQLVDVRSDSDWPVTVCKIECRNQDDIVTAEAAISVLLPSHELGMPSYPTPPADGGLLPGMD